MEREDYDFYVLQMIEGIPFLSKESTLRFLELCNQYKLSNDFKLNDGHLLLNTVNRHHKCLILLYRKLGDSIFDDDDCKAKLVKLISNKYKIQHTVYGELLVEPHNIKFIEIDNQHKL